MDRCQHKHSYLNPYSWTIKALFFYPLSQGHSILWPFGMSRIHKTEWYQTQTYEKNNTFLKKKTGKCIFLFMNTHKEIQKSI